MRITTGGNVGIGTTAPVTKLEVTSTRRHCCGRDRDDLQRFPRVVLYRTTGARHASGTSGRQEFATFSRGSGAWGLEQLRLLRTRSGIAVVAAGDWIRLLSRNATDLFSTTPSGTTGPMNGTFLGQDGTLSGSEPHRNR